MDKQFDALERISKNVHFNQHKRLRNSTATGLTSEQCHILISESALKHFAEQDQGLFARFIKRQPKKAETNQDDAPLTHTTDK